MDGPKDKILGTVQHLVAKFCIKLNYFSSSYRQGLERNWNTAADRDQKTDSESNSLDLVKSSPKRESNPASAAKTPNEEFTEGETKLDVYFSF